MPSLYHVYIFIQRANGVHGLASDKSSKTTVWVWEFFLRRCLIFFYLYKKFGELTETALTKQTLDDATSFSHRNMTSLQNGNFVWIIQWIVSKIVVTKIMPNWMYCLMDNSVSVEKTNHRTLVFAQVVRLTQIDSIIFTISSNIFQSMKEILDTL